MDNRLKPLNLLERDTSAQNVQALRASGAVVWRNNKGGVTYKGGRYVPYGLLARGSSDFIGYLPVRITPQMVGRIVAVFVACENKRSRGGTITDDQQAFIDGIRAGGGIAGVASRWEDARALVTDWFREVGAGP